MSPFASAGASSGRGAGGLDAGDIVRLDFTPSAGQEMRGPRFALVVSRCAFNQASGIVWVCPISQVEAADQRAGGFLVTLMGADTRTVGSVPGSSAACRGYACARRTQSRECATAHLELGAGHHRYGDGNADLSKTAKAPFFAQIPYVVPLHRPSERKSAFVGTPGQLRSASVITPEQNAHSSTDASAAAVENLAESSCKRSRRRWRSWPMSPSIQLHHQPRNRCLRMRSRDCAC